MSTETTPADSCPRPGGCYTPVTCRDAGVCVVQRSTSHATPDYIVKQALLVPQPWDDGGHVHNWRNHVRCRVRSIWDTFSDVQKIAIAGDADDEASREEWE